MPTDTTIMLGLGMLLAACGPTDNPTDDAADEVGSTDSGTSSSDGSSEVGSDGMTSTDETSETATSANDTTDTTDTTETGFDTAGEVCCCCTTHECVLWPVDGWPAGSMSCVAYQEEFLGCPLAGWEELCNFQDGFPDCFC
ncbi:hypothetical protein ACNOYE_34845 [Nannocystaceae bacterium ST9]